MRGPPGNALWHRGFYPDRVDKTQQTERVTRARHSFNAPLKNFNAGGLRRLRVPA